MKRARLSLPTMPLVVVFVLCLSATLFLLGWRQAQVAKAVQPIDCGTVVYNRCLNAGYFTNEQRMSASGNPGNQFPWPNWYGYTDSNGVNNTWAIPQNIDNNMPSLTAAENFISYMSWALSQPYNFSPSVPVWESCSGCGDYVHEPWDVQRRFVTGAAFVIDTMLNRWGTDYGSGDAGITNGINYARNNFNRWADKVRAFAAAGRIDWNYIELQPPHLNTTSVGFGYSARDVNYFNFVDWEWSSLIRFYSPDGSIYRINRICLNVTGAANLPDPAVIQGRIYQDDNGNGVRNGGEPFIQNGVNCTSAPNPRVTLNAGITVSGVTGVYVPQYCNNDPYYRVLVIVPGGHTVSVRPPPGWQATGTNGACGTNSTGSVVCNVANGVTYDQWFGVWPIVPACGSATATPSNPEPNQKFNVAVNFTVSPTNSSGDVDYSVTLSFDQAGITIPAPNPKNGTLENNQSSSSLTFKNLTGSAGNYDGHFNINLENGKQCNGNFNLVIGAKPYLRVYGGDIFAGGTIGQSCTPTTNSGIVGYNTDTPSWGGGGVQFGQSATASVYQFTSAALRFTEPPPNPANGLSFANTGAGVNGTWGGTFGSAPCQSDYSTVQEVNAPAGNSFGGITVGPNGRYVIKRVNQNVIISNNICFGACGSDPSWANANQVPSFYLVVIGGNIYIDKNVTQLDGVFIAQPKSGTGGTIYTCAENTSAVPRARLLNDCGTKLTVNGALVANQVKFLRTKGTLNSAPKATAGTPASQLGLQWKTNGRTSGKYCVKISEAADPDTWDDNYLCTNEDIGLRWSSAGPIAGMSCVQWLEASDPDTWNDNYLCGPAGNTYGLQWSSAGVIAGRYCTSVNEPAEPPSHTWADNYICEPIASGTPGSSATPESKTSGNIAEVINYSPEIWIAPGPFGQGTLDTQSITSLPPVL